MNWYRPARVPTPPGERDSMKRVFTALALILFVPALILSMAFSFMGVLVILTLESTAHPLIPDWEDSLPPYARLAADPPSSVFTHAHE